MSGNFYFQISSCPFWVVEKFIGPERHTVANTDIPNITVQKKFTSIMSCISLAQVRTDSAVLLIHHHQLQSGLKELICF